MDIMSTKVGRVQRGRNEKVGREAAKYLAAKSDFIIETDVEGIYRLHPSATDIPAFPLPVKIGTDSKDRQQYVIDGREFCRADGAVIKRQGYEQLLILAALTRLWEDDRDAFMNMAGYVSSVFGSWVSRILNTSFNLQLGEDEIARTTFIAYMTSLFDSKEYFVGPIGSNRMVKLMSKQAKAGREDYIREIMSRETPSELNLFDILANNYNGVDSDVGRFDRTLGWFLNVIDSELSISGVGDVISRVTSHSWAGSNPALYATLALEYPPALMAMIHDVQAYTYLERTKVGAAVKEASRRRVSVDEVPRWIKMKLIEERKDGANS